MTESFVIGLCLVLVVVRLFIGNPGRPTIIAALVVGAAISVVGDLANGGTEATTSLAGVVERLGQLGG